MNSLQRTPGDPFDNDDIRETTDHRADSLVRGANEFPLIRLYVE